MRLKGRETENKCVKVELFISILFTFLPRAIGGFCTRTLRWMRRKTRREPHLISQLSVILDGGLLGGVSWGRQLFYFFVILGWFSSDSILRFVILEGY